MAELEALTYQREDIQRKHASAIKAFAKRMHDLNELAVRNAQDMARLADKLTEEIKKGEA